MMTPRIAAVLGLVAAVAEALRCGAGGAALSRFGRRLPVLENNAAPAEEIERRRNLAIISHPDAGKTTLTEKLLLYGDAIQQAGMVKARANGRSSTSDFLKMEKERGISISSTCLTFEYGASRVNLMDTPGHADFSEDTYRTLSAADNAVMLVDGGKGLEPQTRKLFGVAKRSRLPVFTFVNKLDRPAMSPWAVLDEIAAEFGLETAVRTWPIGDGDRFRGVLDVATDTVWLYERGARGDKAMVRKVAYAESAPLIGDDDLVAQLAEDREMIAELTPPLDDDQLRTGAMTAVYFGSAMSDAGVEPFLDEFIDLGSRPAPRTLLAGDADKTLPPTNGEFAGYVFKMQANLDPKHRDCMAYVRIVSGKFTKGMKVTHARTGRTLTLATAAMLFGAGKDSVEDAFPGDIIGLNNPAGGLFQIGDALHSGATTIAFEPIPEEDRIARVSGGEIIVEITSDRYDESPMVLQGPGAGLKITAAGLFADLLRLSRSLVEPAMAVRRGRPAE